MREKDVAADVVYYLTNMRENPKEEKGGIHLLFCLPTTTTSYIIYPSGFPHLLLADEYYPYKRSAGISRKKKKKKLLSLIPHSFEEPTARRKGNESSKKKEKHQLGLKISMTFLLP
jgi:hypothetical protein